MDYGFISRGRTHGTQGIHALRPGNPRHQFHRECGHIAGSQFFHVMNIFEGIEKTDNDRIFIEGIHDLHHAVLQTDTLCLEENITILDQLIIIGNDGSAGCVILSIGKTGVRIGATLHKDFYILLGKTFNTLRHERNAVFIFGCFL